MPLAVPGRWRATTSPPTRTREPWGSALEVGARDRARPAARGAQQRQRVLGRASAGASRSRRSSAPSARAPRSAGAPAAARAAARAGVPAARAPAGLRPPAATPSCHSARARRRRRRPSASHAPDQARRSSAGAPGAGARGEVAEAAERAARARARRRAPRTSSALHALDVAQAEPHARRRRRPAALDRALHRAGVDVGPRARSIPRRCGLVHEAVGRVEAHRLLVEQRAQELRRRSARAARSTGRRAGRRRRRGPWGSRSRRSPRPSPRRARPSPSSTPWRAAAPATKLAVVGLDRRLRALAAHRPAQPLGLARREAGEGLRDLDHLVLEDDRAERVAQHRLERRVLVGDLVVRVLAQALPALDVGVDRAALDRARAARSRPGSSGRRGSPGACAAATASARGSRSGRRRSCRPRGSPRRSAGSSKGIRERSIRSPRVRAIASTQRSTAESIPRPSRSIFRKPASRAGVLVPLHHLPALHRRRHDRAAVDQRPGGDDHPARVLGEVAGQPVGLARPAAPASASGPAGRARRPSALSTSRVDVARRRSPPRRAPRARSPPAAGRAPCRARGSPRARGRSGRRRPAPSARARSARARAGSAPRGCRAGSRGRCPAARSAPR